MQKKTHPDPRTNWRLIRQTNSFQDVLAAEGQSESGKGRSFLIIALTNLIILVSVTLPTPLYQLYKSAFSLSSAEITLVFTAYAIAIIPTLFVMGPFGDRIGRKPVLLIAIIAATVGTVLIGVGGGPAWLIAGRVIQGIGVGTASGNSAAALVEFEPNKDQKRASLMAAISLFAGLAVGPLLSGLIVQYLPDPLHLVYFLGIVALLVVLGLLFTVKEPKKDPYKNKAPVFRMPQIPSDKKSPFVAASIITGISFALVGLYFSLAPSYGEALFNTKNVALGGAVTALMAFAGLVAQYLVKNVKPKRLMVAGQFSLIAGLAVIVMAKPIGSAGLFILGAILSGVAFGMIFRGGIGIVNAVSPPEQRSNLTSFFFAIAYAFLIFPILGIGIITDLTMLFVAFEYFAIGEIVMAVVGVVWIWPQKIEQ